MSPAGLGGAGCSGGADAPRPQEFFSTLQERAVAYINVDISVFGTRPGLRAGGGGARDPE